MTRSGRTLIGRMTWGFGTVLILATANYGLGWGWDRVTDDTRRAPAPRAPATPDDSTTLPPDPRADLPSMAAYPWRERYFDDIRRMPGGYWPFTETRPGNFRSPLVNVEGWERRSYRPAADEPVPTVWMLGGSTTWGEGQRDEHTIISQLARLAEDEGVPFLARNYGQRGWTHFQEMVLYEQLLAEGPPPDISFFYDGLNEITTQSLLTEAVPGHSLAYAYALELTGQSIATRFVQDEGASDVRQQAWDAYSEYSAVHKIVRWFKGGPAGANAAQGSGDGELGEQYVPDQKLREDGSIVEYPITEQDGVDAGQVYERGKALTMELSERHDVRSLFFWQPASSQDDAQRAARAELEASTVDLGELLLDHPEVYIDPGHTNEEGARIVAEELWMYLEPEVRRWYEENG